MARQEAKLSKLDADVDELVRSNAGVAKHIDELSRVVEWYGPTASDAAMCALFSEANLHILETIKVDDTLRCATEA